MRQLKLPIDLDRLIMMGAWPLSPQECAQQDYDPAPIPSELVEQLVPGVRRIHLSSPPFHTVEVLRQGGERSYWDEYGDLERIDPALTLVLGDFDLGSDTAFALDYRSGAEPTMIRLAWPTGAPGPHWVPFFDTFADFAAAFRLEERKWR